jgi:hypothetical protein
VWRRGAAAAGVSAVPTNTSHGLYPCHATEWKPKPCWVGLEPCFFSVGFSPNLNQS